MKKLLLSKLRDRAGESIAETLIGLLISALALMMLAGALTSASNIVNKSKATMGDYYSDQNDAAAKAPDLEDYPELFEKLKDGCRPLVAEASEASGLEEEP